MRKILFLLVMVTAFVACSDDDKDNNSEIEKLLIGTWIEDTEMTDEVYNLQFSPDYSGYFWVTDDGVINKLGKKPFTWSVSGTNLYTKEEGESITYKIDTDNDRLKVFADGDSIIYKKRII